MPVVLSVNILLYAFFELSRPFDDDFDDAVLQGREGSCDWEIGRGGFAGERKSLGWEKDATALREETWGTGMWGHFYSNFDMIVDSIDS